jgi:phosphonate transport system ATP-binding protein
MIALIPPQGGVRHNINTPKGAGTAKSHPPKAIEDLMISIEHLNKTFAGSLALSDVNLRVEKGEMVALIGASGSGKSTLIRHMAGLVKGDADSGSLTVNGKLIQEKGVISKKIRAVRSGIGVVFQGFNLVGRLNVETNVMLGALGRAPLWRSIFLAFGKGERELALTSMEKVGILKTAGRRSSTLSGGQRQRAAIARALVQKAEVILADEPIASLDPESSRRVMEILEKLNKEDGLTVVVSLHQVDYAMKYCKRAVALNGGKICFDGPSSSLTPALMKEIYGGNSEDFWGQEEAREPKGFSPSPSFPQFAEDTGFSGV